MYHLIIYYDHAHCDACTMPDPAACFRSLLIAILQRLEQLVFSDGLYLLFACYNSYCDLTFKLGYTSIRHRLLSENDTKRKIVNLESGTTTCIVARG